MILVPQVLSLELQLNQICQALIIPAELRTLGPPQLNNQNLWLEF